MFPNAVAYAIPFFVLFVLVEAWWIVRKRGQRYATRDAITSIAMGVGNQLVAIAVGTAFVAFFYQAFYQYRWIHSMPINIWSVALCFVLDDFFYYWFHRISHERRWFWASHVVHHSSQRYNLSTALRQTWTGKLTFSFIFSAPLLLIGFPLEMVVFVAGVNLVYQFWIHTELITKLGPLEYIFNTPSHHRVHHATNPRYLDANYAGVFIVWDKLFGTFVPELDEDKPTYGIIKNIDTFNPFKVALHEWLAIFKDVRGANNLREALCYLFATPGWSADGSRQTTKEIKRRWKAQGREHETGSIRRREL